MNSSEPDPQAPVRGWHAYTQSAGPKGEPDPTPGFSEGAVVKLMAEDDVDVPLWEVGVGLVFDGTAELIAFGASAELANDVASWAVDRQRNGRRDESDLAALRLIERLRREFEFRYEFVFRP